MVEAGIVVAVLIVAINRGWLQKGINSLSNLLQQGQAQGQGGTCPDGSTPDASGNCPPAAGATPPPTTTAPTPPATTPPPGAPAPAAVAPGQTTVVMPPPNVTILPGGEIQATPIRLRRGTVSVVGGGGAGAGGRIQAPIISTRQPKPPKAPRASNINNCAVDSPCGSNCTSPVGTKFVCCVGKNLSRRFVASRAACTGQFPNPPLTPARR